MFEFYHSAKEITLVFQDGRLIYANESALHFFGSYFHVLKGKPLDFFFQTSSFDGEEVVTLANGTTMVCNCHTISKDGGTFLVIQQSLAPVQPLEIKLQTPNVLYDPLALGKSTVMIQSITESLQNILQSTHSLMQTEGASLKLQEGLQEISRNADEIYQKTKYMMDEYVSLQLDQTRVVSCFDLKDAVRDSCKAIEEYIALEKLPVTLHFSGRKQDCFVLADKEELMKAFGGFFACLVRYLIDHELHGKLNVKCYGTGEEALVIIEDNAKMPVNVFETFSYTDSFQFLSPQDPVLLSMQSINSLIESNHGSIHCLLNPGVGMRYTIRFPLTKPKRFREKEKEIDIRSIIFHEMEFFLSL